MWYREFYIRGGGREIASNSDRNEPIIHCGAPIILNKFNVKTAEIPLTFSPKTVDPIDMTFYTAYTTNAGNVITFTDVITFSTAEYFTGILMLEKMTEKLTFHTSLTLTAHTAAGTVYTNPGPVGGAFQLSATNLLLQLMDTAVADLPFPASVLYPGRPYLRVPTAPTTGAGGDTAVASVTISFPAESQIANFCDFPYWNRPQEWVANNTTTTPANTLSTDSTVPSLRTRPSYLLLHSNIRPGTQYMATGRPDNSKSATAIAKIPIRMDSTQQFGTAAQIWTNEVQHPDLFIPANDMEYTELKFWLTYPDGLTKCQFSGNNFSLTLSALVRSPSH
jgi:hypothetical protein